MQYNTIEYETRYLYCTAGRISHNITQTKIQQSICVSKHLIMCTPLVENIPMHQVWFAACYTKLQK